MTCEYYRVAGWSSSVARRAHNPKVVGSNPAPATRKIKGFRFSSEAFFRKRDLFPHYCSCPQSPCLSGLRASTRLRRNPCTLFAEGMRPAPLSHPFLPVARSGKPCSCREIPARTTGRSRHERQRCRECPVRKRRNRRTIVPHGVPLLLFCRVYSWSNRSSTRCRVMPSSEAAANASDTLSLGTTIKTYSSPPVSHSRIVRP